MSRRAAAGTLRGISTPPNIEEEPATAGSVVLRGVTKTYGLNTAVRDVSLSVLGGEYLAILGPSGSGKTTLIGMVSGLVAPTCGAILLSGTDVGRLPAYRRDVNTVFQNYALFPHMSVEENVGYGLRMKRVAREERRDRVRDMLKLVRLEDARRARPGELSGGMQQRIALARALVNEPAVLLLDEPLGALDRQLREAMQEELRRLQGALGTTFIHVTHDQEEALSICDRLAVMRDGRVEQLGAPANVYENPTSYWVAAFVGASSQIQGVVRAAGAELQVDTDLARIVAARPHGTFSPGDRVTALVRPEDVRFIGGGPHMPAPNQISATLRDLLSLGSVIKAVAVTPGGLELTARLPREAAEDLIVGETVSVLWPPSAVHVYPVTNGTP
jgi:spermidine/putrescine transport system ATP-binding protein